MKVLNLKEIKEFKRLCKLIGFDITYMAVKKQNRGLIQGIANPKLYPTKETLPKVGDDVIRKLYVLVSGTTEKSSEDEKFLQETWEDKIYIVSGEVKYEYALNAIKQEEAREQAK